MKKFLVVLLALGLIAAFGTTASAADVKFGGDYYVVGVYNDNPTAGDNTGSSRAYFYQRVRLQPVFAIAEGLTFTARMDAMEKQWGNTNWRRGTSAGDDTTSSRTSITTVGAFGTTQVAQKVQENFEFERGYVTFKTGIGQFDVGYQSVDTFGTVFGDSGTTRPRIKFTTQAGPITLLAVYDKVFEADTNAARTRTAGAGAWSIDPATGLLTQAAPKDTYVSTFAGKVDADRDTYALLGIYKGKGMEAGLLYKYYAFNDTRTAATPYRTKMQLLSPYMKATFGPVFVEAEVIYFFGKSKEFEMAGSQDVDLEGLGAYLHAKTNLGPAYVGVQFGFSSGDDMKSTTKSKTNPTGGGTDWNPALILMNDELGTWGPGSVTASNSQKFNTIIYNLYAGFNPTPKLNIEAALTYAAVDEKALTATVDAVSNKLGTEFDVKATYKIYDNLSYMVGAGYLWTGDYFKGASAATKIGNDYLLMNRLLLTF